MNLRIYNLVEHKKYIPTVAKWVYDEWSSKYGERFEVTLKKTENTCNENKIPLTLIAFIDNEPVGVVALWENDLESRRDIRPYMATLYVIPEERGKGIGKKLMEAAIQKAKELGEKRIYLITNIDNLYEKFGWKLLSKEKTRHGNEVNLYELII